MRLSFTLIVSACLVLTAFGAQTKEPNQSKKTGTTAAGPTISSFEPTAKLLTFCPGSSTPDTPRQECVSNWRTTVTLEVVASDQTNETLSYSYSTTAGEIVGNGPRVTWNLETAPDVGTPTAKVTVRNRKGLEASASTTIDIVWCKGGCLGAPGPPCPQVIVKSTDKVAHRAERVVFEATVLGDFLERPDYIWTVTGGTIVKGQHTPRLQVLVTGEIDTDVTARLQVTGFDRSCFGLSDPFSLPIRP